MLKEGAIVKLDGIDPEFSEPIADSFATVITKYPSVKDAFAGITTEDTKGEYFSTHETGMAAYDPSTQLIHLNVKHYSNRAELEQKYAESLAKKFHPEGTTVDSNIVHEMGHAIDRYVSEKIIPRHRFIWNQERVSQRIWNNDIKAGQKSGEPMTGKSIRDGLSGYASKSAGEYLAEGFSEFMTSSNPRPMATKIGKRVEQYIRKAEKAGE